MSGQGWNWGEERDESKEDVDNALREVMAAGKHRARRRNMIIGSTLAVLVLAGFGGGLLINN